MSLKVYKQILDVLRENKVDISKCTLLEVKELYKAGRG